MGSSTTSRAQERKDVLRARSPEAPEQSREDPDQGLDVHVLVAGRADEQVQRGRMHLVSEVEEHDIVSSLGRDALQDSVDGIALRLDVGGSEAEPCDFEVEVAQAALCLASPTCWSGTCTCCNSASGSIRSSTIEPLLFAESDQHACGGSARDWHDRARGRLR